MNFTLENHEKYFSGKPVVFLGVNHLSFALEQNNNPLVTGVVEAISMWETLSLTSSLFNEEKHVLAITDGTPTGKADLQSFQIMISKIPNTEFSVVSLEYLAYSELQNILEELEENTVIFLISGFKDKNGKHKSFDEFLALIKNKTECPILHCWEHGIGRGILGGRVVSHFSQGVSAAKKAKEILTGTSPKEMPVTTHSPNRYMFDAIEMERLRIPVSALPKNSIVLNRPKLYWTRERIWLAFEGAIIVILFFVSLFLLLDCIKRWKIQKKLEASERRFRSYFELDLIGMAVTSPDKRWLDVNAKACRILGYSKQELLGMTWEEITFSEDVAENRKHFDKVMEGIEDGYNFNKRFVRKNGEIIHVELSTSCVRDMRGCIEYFVVLIEDISKRVQVVDELKSSYEFLHTLIDTIPAPVYYKNLKGIYLGCNKLFAEKIIGHPTEEIIGKTMFDLTPRIPVELCRIYHESDLELISNKEQQFYEASVKVSDGKLRDFYFNKAIYKDSAGNDAGVVGIMLDITERKEIESRIQKMNEILEEKVRIRTETLRNTLEELRLRDAELHKSEMRYKSLFASNHAVMLIVDPEDGRILDVNSSACTYYGYSREQMLNKNISDINVLSAEEVSREMQLARQQERNQFFFKHRLADGKIRDVEVYSGPVELPDKLVLYSIVHDITKRKTAENALIESEHRFRVLFESAGDAIFIMKENLFVDCNRRALEIFGSEWSKLARLTLFDLSPKRQPDGSESAERLFDYIKKSTSGEPQVFEWCCKRIDGSTFDAEINLNFFELQNTALIQAIIRDVTERKKAEKRLKSYANTQAVLLREVNHRVKNNLSSIISMLHIELDRHGEKAGNTLTRMVKELIGKVKSLATVHSLLTASGWQPFRLEELCRRIAGTALESFPHEKNVELDVANSEILISSHQAHHLTLILNELVTNSMKYALKSNRPLVSIRIGEDETKIHLIYKDNGPGFPKAVLETPEKESNIGFELVYGIIRQSLGGIVKLKNEHGAVTEIIFPKPRE